MTRSRSGNYTIILALAVAAMALSSWSCSGPEPEGGYIPKVPAGFIYDANCYAGRKVFPQREILSESAWMTLREEEYSTIWMTEYSDTAEREDVWKARDAQANRYANDRRKYSAVEEVLIDGRFSWGWLETQYSHGAVVALEYKAVVPYDGVTWSVEFLTKDPQFMDASALKEKVASFRFNPRNS